MLREYYLYKNGNPKMQLDSALSFADQALILSQSLKYNYGKTEAILVKGDVLIRKNEIAAALTLLSSTNDSTRFRFLIIFARHYLFHKDRTRQFLDSSLIFLEQAGSISPDYLSAKWQPELIHIRAMHDYIRFGLKQSKKQYKALIDIVSFSGDEEREALLWHELATLIPIREDTGVTRLYCYEKMRSLYYRAHLEEREAWTLKCMADIYIVNNRPDLAETALLNSLELYKKIGYPELYHIYDLLAIAYRSKGDFSKCIFYGSKAIASAEATDDSTSALTFYGQLANVYREMGQPDKSVQWYSKLLNNRLFKDGDNFYKFRDAGLFARELIKINREKEALEYILDIGSKNKPAGADAKACLLGALAYCYETMGRKWEAEKYYSELINIAPQLQNDNEIAMDVNHEIGNYLVNRQQYGKALPYLQKALVLSERMKAPVLSRDIYLLLYKADSGMGNLPRAIQHLLKHNQLNDSIFNETRNWQIAELQVQFETAKREKDIELLNKQNQFQLNRVGEINRTKNITLAGAAMLLIIIGLLFNRYLLKQKSNHRLKISQKELDQKNNSLQALIAQQDTLLKEKEWLMKEVHHRVKNNLQMVTGLLYSQSVYLEDDKAKEAVKDSLRRMQAMSLIHQMLYKDENAAAIGMQEYIHELLRYLQDSLQSEKQVIFRQTVEPLNLDVSQAIPIGLIITEGIVNAVKYAFLRGQAGIVDIEFRSDGDEYSLLKISDNGIGLPSGLDTKKHQSLGLELMHGLAKQLKGEFHIKSEDGVHITVRFPDKL